MDFKRREFLRLAAAGLTAVGLAPNRLWSFFPDQVPAGESNSPLWPQMADDEYPFPYDDSAFLCAERIFDLRPNPDGTSRWRADLNLLLREEANLEIKIYTADSRERLGSSSPLHSMTGVQGSLTVPLFGGESERLFYQVQFRRPGEGWSALSPKSFRLPNARLSQGGQIRVLAIADDHTFDDADPGIAAAYREMMVNGDYVNEFLKQLRNNPNWTPPAALQRLDNGFELARILRHILANEDPDFLIHLGDTNGIGSSYRFRALGFPEYPSTDAEREMIARTLWLRMRKIYSALTPSLPMFIALGNHDGEESWNSLRTQARTWRQKYFPLPTRETYAEGGHPDGNYYAFTWGADADGRGGVEFIILDCTAFCGPLHPLRLQDWTLGPEQKEWFAQVLKKREKHWILPCFHHVLGGWPAGPDESRQDVAYGRGPLFLRDDYRPYADPQTVEQVALTEMAAEAGVNAFLYGHDHVFHKRRLTTGWNRKDMSSLCCGSPKHIGEVWWWQGALWKKFYGQNAAPSPQFIGPPGYTRLTIAAQTITADFISAAGSSPSGGQNIVSRVVLNNPAPRLAADPPLLRIEIEEGKTAQVKVPLRIKNEGAGGLEFSLSSSRSWIQVKPSSGKSWGEWENFSVVVRPNRLMVGTYQETIAVSGPGAENTPLAIPLQITISSRTIIPPQNLRGEWRRTRDGRDFVLLTWNAARDNHDLSRYNVYVAEKGEGPYLAAFRPLNKCDYIYRRGQKRPLTFMVTAVNLQGRESEPAVCEVK